MSLLRKKGAGASRPLRSARRVGQAVLPVLAAVALSGLPAFAAAGPSPVSGPSPFAGCTSVTPPPVASPPGTATLYPNTEVEPFVASNPANSDNLIGVWQQDVYSTRSARGAVAAYSTNGGKTWGTTPLPFTGCAPSPLLEPSTGKPYDAVYDNWVSVGPDGTAYTTAAAGNSTTSSNGIVAAASTDGGKTWSDATTIVDSVQDPSGQHKFFNDKPSVTADPARAGAAYAVWDQLSASRIFPIYTSNSRGPALFSRTTDGGRTWSTPAAIYDPGEQNQTIDNQVVVVHGVLYDFFDLLSATGNTAPGGGTTPVGHVAFITSADGGQTWSAPTIVAGLDTVGVSDPNTGAAVTTGGITSLAPAFDPVTGELYAVWQDGRFSGGRYDEIAVSSSADLGKTWSAAARLSTDTGRPAFNPAIAVRADGTVGVSYYDLRALSPTNTTTLPTGYWLKELRPGAAGFGPDVPLWPAGQPFNLMAAPVVAGGYFLGDYQGLSSSLTSLFVATTCSDSSCVGKSNPTDVYTGSP
ncbi:hypothetical protein [Sinomonas sp. G460-2]|uniref:hypothetical protein n=1 Tax=Sinomonas sp. G460-2 TaxID=3393464 RepID=UPI0039EF4FD9